MGKKIPIHLCPTLLALLVACSTTPSTLNLPTVKYQASTLNLPTVKFAKLKEISVGLVEPVQAAIDCRADTILVSLPDEVVCKIDSGWLFRPSYMVLPPSDQLLVSLRFAGLSGSAVGSLTEAKAAGYRLAILPLLLRADAKIIAPADYSGEPIGGKSTRVIATVKFHFVVVDLITTKVLWRGPLEQIVENLVPVPFLNESRVLIEAGAGIGEYEPQLYAMRSLVVQAYAQLGHALAHKLAELLEVGRHS